MDFVELKVQVGKDFSDILMAELAEIGYDSFVDTEEGLDAYIDEASFEEDALQKLVLKYQDQTGVQYAFSTLERKNWNEEWENSYEPIVVNDTCLVRAAFHPADERFRYQIVITPKMSFGTGHHETTVLMLTEQLQTNHQGRKVLDVGCGTGILAIMASMLGASRVMAFDIDEWAVENARENVALNHGDNITVEQGTLAKVGISEKYDIVLANINRNVLLEEIPSYAALLQPCGLLLVSGFYESDVPDIVLVAAGAGLVQKKQGVQNRWTCITFQKE
jgi:ribosomal protein L11 methyltransferase